MPSQHRQQAETARDEARALQDGAQAARADEAQALESQASANHALHQLELRRDAEQKAAAAALDEQARNQALLASVVARREAEIEERQREVERIYQTKVFRYSRVPRRIYSRLRRRRLTQPVSLVNDDGPSSLPMGGSYDLWVATYDTLTDEARDDFRRRTARLDDSAGLLDTGSRLQHP